MSLFRSDPMGYFSLVASKEYAWDILNELGEIGALQFIDLNAHESNFKRPYSNFVKRCEDLEIKIQNIENYMTQFELPIEKCEDTKEFLGHLKHAITLRNRVERTYLDDVEAEINDRMGLLNEQIKSYETLIENYNNLSEYKEVLLKTREFIQREGDGDDSAFRDIRFAYLAGVINKEDSLRFRKILFRVTRGMTMTALMDIDKQNQALLGEDVNQFLESSKNHQKERTVFFVMYQGGEHGMLKGKLDRICDAFSASKYGVPIDNASFNKKLNEIEGQLLDSQGIVQKTKVLIGSILQYFSDPRAMNHPYSHIEGLKLFVKKEKALYHNLNMLKPQHVLNVGNCWCPLDKVSQVQSALQNLSQTKGNIGSCEFREIPIPAGISPPTHFKTNDVTFVFQEIVNTYGIPRYREINPGLFTIATFPFLFGVMFGDILHGLLLAVFGIYLIFAKESLEKEKDSKLKMVLPVRYLLVLQGLFALYCGMIYNDFAAIPLNLFGTAYKEEGGQFIKAKGENYPLGIDPEWYHKANELTFLNSFKMKLAIIIGVAHMTFGILLRGLNNVFARKALDFICEFVPMLVFLTLTFGYMVFLIVAKWATPWDASDPFNLPAKAPSIITVFIKMVLQPGKWDPTVGKPLYGDADGSTQAALQLMFLAISGVCAVIILFPKPIILHFQKSKNQHVAHTSSLPHTGYNVTENLLNPGPDENQVLIGAKGKGHDSQGGAEGDDSFGELFVHQIIETIEFVLGSVSNTASYLRLWALSLAHSQLAKVFFDNTILSSIESGNPIGAFIYFHIFAGISFGVLLLMSNMECFLHALRLHWVEFQNKFYKADGHSFVPFSFEKELTKTE